MVNYFRLTLLLTAVVALYLWYAPSDKDSENERRVVLEKRDIGSSIPYPTAGTVLVAGSSYSFPFIAPNGAGSNDAFTVYLFVNGQLHSSIANGLKWDQKTFQWQVPSLASRNDYSIRVANGDANRAPLTLDSSRFTIVSLAVIQPAAGAAVSAGDVISVKFNPAEVLPSYELELWNAGKKLTVITQLPAGSSNTEIFWPVPAVLPTANTYHLMLYGLKSGARALLGASGNFTISESGANGQLKVRSPDRSQRWAKGSSQTISFDPPANIALQYWNIDIYCLVPGAPLEYGATIAKNLPVIPSSKTMGMETFWVPGKYFVRIWGWAGSQGPPGRPIFGVSEVFTLTEVAGATLTGERAFAISVPFTSQSIDAGTAFTIEWKITTKKSIDFINIELYDDYKAQSIQQAFVTTLVNKLPPTTTSYTWNIPANLPQSNFYYIRVWGYFTGSSKSSAVQVSDYFSINNDAVDTTVKTNGTTSTKKTDKPSSKGPAISYTAEDLSTGAQVRIPFWTITSGRLFFLFNFVLICFVI